MSKEAIKYITATLAAFGPDEAISMTKETWAKLREAIKTLAEQPAQQQENVSADAYDHACDEMERWQHQRRKAGKEVGTTGSLCDGISWLYGYIDELEAKTAQRTWVGLTDEEQQAAYNAWQQKDDGWGSFYALIEAKLKEKNNG